MDAGMRILGLYKRIGGSKGELRGFSSSPNRPMRRYPVGQSGEAHSAVSLQVRNQHSHLQSEMTHLMEQLEPSLREPER